MTKEKNLKCPKSEFFRIFLKGRLHTERRKTKKNGFHALLAFSDVTLPDATHLA
jgi:hypothetical protein